MFIYPADFPVLSLYFYLNAAAHGHMYQESCRSGYVPASLLQLQDQHYSQAKSRLWYVSTREMAYSVKSTRLPHKAYYNGQSSFGRHDIRKVLTFAVSTFLGSEIYFSISYKVLRSASPHQESEQILQAISSWRCLVQYCPYRSC